MKTVGVSAIASDAIAAPRAYCDPRSMAVLGLGCALPTTMWTTEDLLQHIREQFDVDIVRAGSIIARRMGIRRRHVCRDFIQRHEAPRVGESNAELAARAILQALQQAQLSPNDLRYLVAHTTTPGQLVPPNVAQVAELLGYQGPIVELRQACTGFANALVFASGVVHGPQAGPVAIVGSETGSVFFDPQRAAEDHGQLVNLVQMGDAAAACVVAPLTNTRSKTIATISHLYCGQIGYQRAPGFKLTAGGSDAPLAVGQRAEFAHDFAAVREHGPKLFAAGVQALQAHGINLHGVQYLIPHQVNGRIAELISAAMQIEQRRVFVNADRVGNTGSAAIWLALYELHQQMTVGESAVVLGAEATKHMFGGFHYLKC